MQIYFSQVKNSQPLAYRLPSKNTEEGMSRKYNESKKDQQNAEEEENQQAPSNAAVKQKKHQKGYVNLINSDKTKKIVKNKSQISFPFQALLDLSSPQANAPILTSLKQKAGQTFQSPQLQAVTSQQDKCMINDGSEGEKFIILADRGAKNGSAFRQFEKKDLGKQIQFKLISGPNHESNIVHDQLTHNLSKDQTPIENGKNIDLYARSEKNSDQSLISDQNFLSLPKLISNHIINCSEIKKPDKQTQKQAKKQKQPTNQKKKPKQPRCYCHYLNCRTQKCSCFHSGRICSYICQCVSCQNLGENDGMKKSITEEIPGNVIEKDIPEVKLSLEEIVQEYILDDIDVGFAPFEFSQPKFQ